MIRRTVVCRNPKPGRHRLRKGEDPPMCGGGWWGDDAPDRCPRCGGKLTELAPTSVVPLAADRQQVWL